VVDLAHGAFASGQVYVALSRCTSFEGLILACPVVRQQLRLDYQVMKFLTGLHYQRAQAEQSLAEKIGLLKAAIKKKAEVEVVYLKGTDEKSHRRIRPKRMYDSEYSGHAFMALDAYCCLRRSDRVFNVERFLSVKAANGDQFSPQR